MKRRVIWSVFVLLAVAFAAQPAAAGQQRIVVVPFFVESAGSKTAIQQKSLKDKILGIVGFGQKSTKLVVSPARDYRRVIGFINNQLVRHNFETVNANASDYKEKEYNALLERAREDSALAAQEMCRRYATDLAYVVWLEVKAEITEDNKCKVKARLEGEGYDSGGRDLGAAVSKSFTVTRNECDDALVEAEKLAADKVGRVLTAYDPAPASARPRSAAVTSTTATVPAAPISSATAPPVEGGGVLARNSAGLENTINIRLEGAIEYTLVEAFGKIVNTVRGVAEAKRYRSKIVPDNPQACLVIWRTEIQGTDPFRLQANIMHMIDNVLDSGGRITLNGVPYRYTADEIDLLKGVRPADATTREIMFVLDMEQVRDRDLSRRHDPYEAAKKGGVTSNRPGFE